MSPVCMGYPEAEHLPRAHRGRGPRAHRGRGPRAHGLLSRGRGTSCAGGSGTPCARATQEVSEYPVRMGVRDPVHTGWSGTDLIPHMSPYLCTYTQYLFRSRIVGGYIWTWNFFPTL